MVAFVWNMEAQFQVASRSVHLPGASGNGRLPPGDSFSRRRSTRLKFGEHRNSVNIRFCDFVEVPLNTKFHWAVEHDLGNGAPVDFHNAVSTLGFDVFAGFVFC